MRTKSSATDLLAVAGLRRTRARRLVLEMLATVDRPLSHQELAARPETQRVDRVTLYRTLATLEQAGLLHRVQGTDGVWRYRGHEGELGRCGGNHIHFLCLLCNQMYCLPEQPLPWVAEPEGFEVYGKQLVVYGRCAECRSRDGEQLADPRRTPRADPRGRAPRGRTRQAPRSRRAPRRRRDAPS